MMKHLQKLGKAMMLPVSVLPVCGILMGLGYALAPAAMFWGREKTPPPTMELMTILAKPITPNLAAVFVLSPIYSPKILYQVILSPQD